MVTHLAFRRSTFLPGCQPPGLARYASPRGLTARRNTAPTEHQVQEHYPRAGDTALSNAATSRPKLMQDVVPRALSTWWHIFPPLRHKIYWTKSVWQQKYSPGVARTRQGHTTQNKQKNNTLVHAGGCARFVSGAHTWDQGHTTPHKRKKKSV